MTKTDIFISYKREQRDLAQKVETALIDAGFVTVSDRNIAKNQEFGDAIDRMIRSARLTLVLWTHSSAKSEWVCQEARLARDLEKSRRGNQYLGVMVQDVHIDLPVDLRGLQMVDLAKNGLDKAGIKKLVKEVQETLGTPLAKNAEQSRVSSSAKSDELQFYTLAHALNTPLAYQKYLETYPDGDYTSDAKKCLRAAKRWYLHPFRRGNLANTIAATAIVATIGTTLFALNSKRDLVIGVDQSKYNQLATALRDEKTKRETAQRRLTDNEKTLANSRASLASNKRQLQALQTQVTDRDSQIAALSKPAIPATNCKTGAGKDGYKIQNKCYAADITLLDLSGSTKKPSDFSDLGLLKGFSKLTRLYVSNTQVSDLSPLGGLAGLTWLSVSNTQVSDLSPLSGLAGLTTLSVYNTQVSDLSPLSGLAGLTRLFVSNTQVSDLSSLSGLAGLTWLSVDNTQVSDLSPLGGLTKLRYLYTPDRKRHDTRKKVVAAIKKWSKP